MFARGAQNSASSSFLAGAAIICAAAIGLGSAAQAKPKFVTFTVADGLPTNPTSINAKGVVTGTYDFSGNYKGFVRQPDGTIETFQVPGALYTDPTSINTKGEITGRYSTEARGPSHGFVRKPDGSIKTFKIPHDNFGDYPVTVNSSGTIFGYYMHGRTFQGFIRARNGTLTIFGCGSTVINAGNDLGAATGGCDRAFVRNPDGTFTFFDAGRSTDPMAMNNEGAVTGTVEDQDSLDGFLRTADGTITLFAVAQSNGTTPKSINNGGTITGNFDNGGVGSGFVRAADGTITTFDPEGSKGTFPTSINDKGAITGQFVDQNDHGVGFIRIP